MADECTDTTNKEQFIFYIRTVDDNLEAKKDFLGFYKERNSCACNGRYFVEV